MRALFTLKDGDCSLIVHALLSASLTTMGDRTGRNDDEISKDLLTLAALFAKDNPELEACVFTERLLKA